MSSSYGLERTNYVRITSLNDLKKWIDKINVDVDIYEKSDGRIALSGYTSDDGCLPSWYEDEHGTEHDYFLGDFAEKFLVNGEILVVMGVSSEKARYCSGFALAIDNNGSSVSVNLNEIYERAAEHFGVNRVTLQDAEY